jgi:hypothetical protein
MSTKARKLAIAARRREKRNKRRRQRIRQYDRIQNVSNLDNLAAAFYNAKKGVSWKATVQNYESHLSKNIAKAAQKVESGEPIHIKFHHFDLNERGKLRHIRSVDIGERVIQKCLCDEVLVKVIGPTLIYDNGACLKGKGTGFAESRLKEHLRDYYKTHKTNVGYYLSADFKSYFDSIPHDKLIEKIAYYIHNEKLIKLIEHFIRSFDEGDFTETGRSIGLGSQISQIAAIFYPNCMDHYVKEVLRIKYYGRYMDDLYMIHESKEHLKHCLDELIRISSDLGLTLNLKKTHILPIQNRHGVTFLKGHYFLLETGRLVVLPSKKSIMRMKRKIVKFGHLIERGEMLPRTAVDAYKSWRGAMLVRFKDSRRLILNIDNFFRKHVGYEPVYSKLKEQIDPDKVIELTSEEIGDEDIILNAA